MRIFGLNILTDKKLNDYGWAFHREHQTPEYLAQVQDVYQDRWERAQEKMKALETELDKYKLLRASELRSLIDKEVDEYRMRYTELQSMYQSILEENESLHKRIVGELEGRIVVESLANIMRIVGKQKP